MRTEKGYKFFKIDECKLLGNSVCDEMGFIFEEGKELSVNFDKEWKENNLLPTWEMNRIIKDAIHKTGIKFNTLPSPYQYFPYYHKDSYENIIFEVVTLGFWIHPKPYSRSAIYSEHIKVLRKVTKEEVGKILNEWDFGKTIA